MKIQQRINATSVHQFGVFSWCENLSYKNNKVKKTTGKSVFFSPECQLFLCWTGISILLMLHFFKSNVLLKKTTKKTISPMLVCLKLEHFDSFCLRSMFGAFVGVKAGSDTWDWCYIINTTYDRICRAQHSSAKTPQSSLASYWSESDVLFAQDTKEIICLEKWSNAVTLWMRLNLVTVRSAASGSRHRKVSQLRYK